MNRRTLLWQAAAATAIATGATALGRRWAWAQEATPTATLASLGLPEAVISVDDQGFTAPDGATAGWVLMTVKNSGTQPLHFFAIRVPDEVSDTQLEADFASPGEEDPAWFDMTKLPMLGNPDWPSPGGQAQGVVDVKAGRWVLVDPIGGRDVALWKVGEGGTSGSAPEPQADVEIGLVEMDFSGLDEPIAAGPSVWKISNQGALEHELALLPVQAGTTKEDVIKTLSDMLQGKGDPELFAPIGGQGIASRGVTSWQQFDLAPGVYAAVCMSPSAGEEFMPHALEGMVKIFSAQ